MKKIKHTILRNQIPVVKLISTTSKNWYDNNDNIVSWTGDTNNSPITNTIVKNLSGNTQNGLVSNGYYKFNGTQWNIISGSTSYVNSIIYPDHQVPLFLDSKVDEYGPMIGFDGKIGQNEIKANFSYTVTGRTVTVYNTTNYGKLKKNIEANFSINWGDNTQSSISTSGSVQKVYTTGGEKTIRITLSAPWVTENVTKIITLT